VQKFSDRSFKKVIQQQIGILIIIYKTVKTLSSHGSNISQLKSNTTLENPISAAFQRKKQKSYLLFFIQFFYSLDNFLPKNITQTVYQFFSKRSVSDLALD